MGIRSAGGIYIRAKQAAILKNTVKEANPMVGDLMDEVQIIASKKLKPAPLPPTAARASRLTAGCLY